MVFFRILYVMTWSVGLEPQISHRYSGAKPILSFEDGQYDLETNPGLDKKPFCGSKLTTRA